MTKYLNKKCEYQGIKFDSMKEMRFFYLPKTVGRKRHD